MHRAPRHCIRSPCRLRRWALGGLRQVVALSPEQHTGLLRRRARGGWHVGLLLRSHRVGAMRQKEAAALRWSCTATTLAIRLALRPWTDLENWRMDGGGRIGSDTAFVSAATTSCRARLFAAVTESNISVAWFSARSTRVYLLARNPRSAACIFVAATAWCLSTAAS